METWQKIGIILLTTNLIILGSLGTPFKPGGYDDGYKGQYTDYYYYLNHSIQTDFYHAPAKLLYYNPLIGIILFAINSFIIIPTIINQIAKQFNQNGNLAAILYYTTIIPYFLIYIGTLAQAFWLTALLTTLYLIIIGMRTI